MDFLKIGIKKGGSWQYVTATPETIAIFINQFLNENNIKKITIEKGIN